MALRVCLRSLQNAGTLRAPTAASSTQRRALGDASRRRNASTTRWVCADAEGAFGDPSSCACLAASSVAGVLPCPGLPDSGRTAEDHHVAAYATRQPTPLRVEEVQAMTDTAATAQLLKHELPIRMANRIAQMDALPYIEQSIPLLCARARLRRSFQDVRIAAEQEVSPADFAKVVKAVKVRHKFQIKRLTLGMQDLKALRLARSACPKEVAEQIDSFLNSFCLSRIGIEMLNSQYLALFSNRLGIVDQRCDPCEVAERAAAAASKLAAAEFAIVPPVKVSFHGLECARTLPLISDYLFYIIVELLKNSFRAVGELHQSSMAPQQLNPILIRVSSDEAQVVMDIFDQGGGIAFEHQPHVWSYMYSTKKGKKGLPSAYLQEEDSTPLAGYGMGLPLSRLYAEYIGGSLHIMSMPNFGTHAFLFLQRCHSRKEGMPTYVDWLRKRRLLEELLELEAQKRAAADREDFAEALRLKGLASEARDELSRLDHWI